MASDQILFLDREEFLADGLSVVTSDHAERCPICLTEPALIELACHHTFCRDCIVTWTAPLAIGTCPICRSQLWEEADEMARYRDQNNSGPQDLYGFSWENEEFFATRADAIERWENDEEGTHHHIRSTALPWVDDITDLELRDATERSGDTVVQHLAPFQQRMYTIDDRRDVRIRMIAMYALLFDIAFHELPDGLTDDLRTDFHDILDTIFELVASTWNGRQGEAADLHRGLLRAILDENPLEADLTDSVFLEEDGPVTYFRWMVTQMLVHLLVCVEPLVGSPPDLRALSD